MTDGTGGPQYWVPAVPGVAGPFHVVSEVGFSRGTRRGRIPVPEPTPVLGRSPVDAVGTDG